MGLNLPTKACHNCRRRRWKCDKSLPVCQKCLHSGQECLGYGKLFTWNQGVAARGKMMGKSFGDLSEPKMAGQQHRSSIVQPNPTFKRITNASKDELVVEMQYEEKKTELQWPLIDPLIKDLNQRSRYYLYHFATQLCSDMVVYDGPDQNPIRDLIPAISVWPVLLQVIIANSACHVHNISQQAMRFSKYDEKPRPCVLAYYREVTRYGGPIRSSYRDALVAKQHGLALLSESVAAINNTNFDIVLLSILLFINYDLIESGQDKWKIHMEGARRLVNLLGEPAFRESSMTKLRKCLLSDLLVFHILGSTLKHAGSCSRLLPECVDVQSILRYAETNNYLSCPAPLIDVMIRAFDVPDHHDMEDATKLADIEARVKVLLQEAMAFDPAQWALTFHPTSPLDDLEKRMRIASAHRSAVCLYIVRVLPNESPLLDPSSGCALISLTSMATDILHHISYLTPQDAVFKSITWPVFLAGAESDRPAERTFILERLDTLWNNLNWGYVRTVREVLTIIWDCKDQAGKGADVCWVDEVRRLGTELLIA